MIDYEKIASDAGWAFDARSGEFRLNDNGEGCDAIDQTAMGWEDLCRNQGLLKRFDTGE